MNFSLIGMPTSGKSILGKRLASELNYNWVDFDKEIVKKFGLNLASNNEIAFRKAEEEVMQRAAGTRQVFSCGGSSVYSTKGMEHMKKISTIIYLKISKSVLHDRQVDYVARGVIGARTKSINQIYDERGPLYQEYANYTVSAEVNDLNEQYRKLKILVTSLL